MTATVRSTPNLTITPTQNTAPVFEFRCLYSHDLRKKKKTWHDGSLRFHTFNKRVMVYDETKNFISDLHWREDDELHEGEELRLDKGVLVEVAERMGKTETDLAPLLEKRRANGNSSPARPVHTRAPLQPINYSTGIRNPSGSQVKPKSLAAVLGASQGPIGRARIATRSPYEQRNNLLNHREGETEPPLKRPRLSPIRQTIGSVGRQKASTLISDTKSADVSPITRHVRIQPVPYAGTKSSAIEISSDSPEKNVSRSARPESRALHPGAANNDEDNELGPPVKATRRDRVQKQRLQSAEDPTVMSAPLTASLNTQSERQSIEDGASGLDSPKAAHKVAVASFRSRSTKVHSQNKLRFGSNKRRKKLLYRELLPKVGLPDDETAPVPQIPSSSPSPVASRVNDGPRPESSRDPERTSKNSVIDLVSEGEDEPAEPAVHGDVLGVSCTAAVTQVAQSPLFCSQKPGDEGIDDLMLSISGLQARFDVSNCSPATAAGMSTGVQDKTSVSAEDERTSGLFHDGQDDEESQTSLLTALDQKLMMLPPPRQAQLQQEETYPHGRTSTTARIRPFRRVRSENDMVTDEDNSSDAEITSEVPRGLDESLETRNSKSKSPIRLQRSVSATDPMLQSNENFRSARAIIPTAIPEEIEDTGPWTVDEAYLLFEWWPPNRKKPIYNSDVIEGNRSPMLKDQDLGV